MLNPNI